MVYIFNFLVMKRYFLTVLLLVAAVLVKGQVLEPVKWSYASKRVSASEAVVYVRASIEKGWHIYSTVQPDGGPMKTSVRFVPVSGVKLLGKVSESRPLAKFEQSFGMQVLYFDGSAVFSQRVKIPVGKSVVVKGSVEFMACDESRCLPPSVVEFSIPVK